MRPMPISRDLQIALHVYNVGVQRSRREYHIDPFAGTRELNKNEQARERMAASRAEKENAR